MSDFVSVLKHLIPAVIAARPTEEELKELFEKKWGVSETQARAMSQLLANYRVPGAMRNTPVEELLTRQLQELTGIWQSLSSKGTTSTGWSSNLYEYCFNPDLSFTWACRYASGYVSSAYSPVQASYSSGPHVDRQKGLYIPAWEKDNSHRILLLKHGEAEVVHVVAQPFELKINGSTYKKAWTALA